MVENSSGKGKLDSWKEIAAYLDRHVTTLQRWEKKEGLPIHRHLHDEKASVYAYPSEIDAWVENRRIGKPAANESVPVAVPAKKPSFRWPTASGIVLLPVLATLAFFWPFVPTPAKEDIDSIAILPFENQDIEPDLEYLSEGIAGEVVYSLSQLSGMRVLPTSAVARYKGQKVTPQEVASDLNVRAVVMGTATQQGENLSLTVELVDAQEDRLLWGRRYTRKFTDLSTLKEELATDISESLRQQLSGTDQNQLMKQHTTDPGAYQDYLRGIHHQRKKLPEDLAKAIAYFNSAIDKDPQYALAYAGLARTYFYQGVYQGHSLDEFHQRGLSAAQKALELDGNLSDAHSVMGAVKAVHGWDWAAGKQHLSRALELNPSDLRAHSTLAQILWRERRWEEALEELEKVKSLDPLSPDRVSFARLHMSRHEYEEAIKLLEEAVELMPHMALPNFHLIWAYWYNGMVEEAIAQAEKWVPLPKVWRGFEQKLPLFLRQLAAGDRAEALRTLENWGRLPPAFKGSYYALLGEEELALEWLSKAVEERYHGASGANKEPAWDSLREDPRFQDLMRQMNLMPKAEQVAND